MSLQRLQKARAGLISVQPFFGNLSLKLALVEDSDIQTSACDGRYLRFNPVWAANAPMPELECVVAHHVLSCALGHHLRRGKRERKGWQEASDYAVNADLIRSGFKLPDGALYDPQYAESYAEAIYATRRRGEQGGDENKSQAPGGVEQGGGGGASQTPGQSPNGAPSPSPEGRGGESEESGPPQNGAGAGATGTIEDTPGEDGVTPADEAEIAEAEQEWQVAVAQAAQAARGQGKLPGCIERAIESFLQAKVSWQEAMQRYYQAKAADDNSWSHPDRRFVGEDIYLPSRHSRKIKCLAYAVDMSGSIKQSDLDQFISEIEEAREIVKPEQVIIMPFDTRVRGDMQILGPDEPIVIKVRAGGGTAFDDPIRKLEEMDITPEVLCYLTDLDSSCFAPEPEYPVLWVSTMKTSAPYGEVIKME